MKKALQIPFIEIEDDYNGFILLEESRRILLEDPVAQRVRWVYFWSSGHEVLIVDNTVMYQIKADGIVSRRKHDGYMDPDRLAQEILSDIPWENRSPELLLARARRNSTWQTGIKRFT